MRGTYAVLADDVQMRRTGADADEFVELLLARHRLIMGGRPEKRPGEFKTKDNRVGETHFVAWQQVEGTLRAGFALRESLDTAWEKAVYTAFVVAEVHPFDDGNGR
ncbi:MAG: Fic family protein, partial [Nocardioides sp.]